MNIFIYVLHAAIADTAKEEPWTHIFILLHC